MLCLNGKYTAQRCLTDGAGQRRMFNPTTNSCTDKVKLPVDRKLRSFKECLLKESVSMNGKWTELSCGSGHLFDKEKQKCIEENTSTFGKYFHGFILKIVFKVFLNNFCISELKPCDENSCQNGGKCQENGTDDYDCLCPIGFTGKNCECNYYNFCKRNLNYDEYNFIKPKKIVVNNPCTEKTCQNGGTCFADKLRQTNCFCKEGFDGKKCEIDQRTSTTKPYSK